MATRRNILITGASAGLGERMAHEFAARGRNLALAARRLDRLEAVRADILAAHPGVTVAVRRLDVTDHEQVFEVFRALDSDLGDLGGLDRVIVNAGGGKGRSIGTGGFADNAASASLNFVAALAQCEAAVELFRARARGHLVVISSMSAVRGLPRHMTTYGAAKAGVAALAEGIRADLLGTPIRVSTVYPGYIVSEGNRPDPRNRLMVSTQKGVASMVRAIERERADAMVPAWPWVPLGFLMRLAPLRLVARFT
jgi:short-subunit dehydrogenase